MSHCVQQSDWRVPLQDTFHVRRACVREALWKPTGASGLRGPSKGIAVHTEHHGWGQEEGSSHPAGWRMGMGDRSKLFRRDRLHPCCHQVSWHSARASAFADVGKSCPLLASGELIPEVCVLLHERTALERLY